MSSARFEAFLARLYVDAHARELFAADPRGAALGAGLDAAEADAVTSIDRVGLELAADSFERKRLAARRFQKASRWWTGLRLWR
jgi:hypothetical protein